MKKIFYIIAALAAITACQTSLINRNDIKSLSEKGLVMFQGDKEISVFLESPGQLSFSIATTNKMEADEEIFFEPADSAEALAAYNAEIGANYWMLPEDNYLIDNWSTTVHKGLSVSDPVTVDIDNNGFRNGVTYCLPLKIVRTSSGIETRPKDKFVFLVARGPIIVTAMSLNGSNAYVDFQSTINDPNLKLDYCTLEIHAKANSFQSRSPYISSIIGVEEQFLVRWGDVSCDRDQLQMAGQGVSLTTAMHFQTGRWYHIAVVGDGINQKCYIYIDGQLIEEQNMGAKGINFGSVYNSCFAIGMSEKGRYLNGQVFEARLWGRMLTQAEIVRNECVLSDPSREFRENKLLGYWKLDNPNAGGTGATDLTGPAKQADGVGTVYNGTYHGSISYTSAMKCPVVQ